MLFARRADDRIGLNQNIQKAICTRANGFSFLNL
jgi:hypothetical protein